ncbi:MAG: hypothetical protein IJU96_01835 [Clostridia bacterium]|nr:hypothetical protein [Clostridia bacterium]
MKKISCRVISALLALVVLLGCVSAAAAVEKKPLYVVLGDSIAFGMGLTNPKNAVYGKIVADTDGYDYENYAIPGHTTANLLQRMQEPTVKAAIRSADIISISIGGNNFLLGNLAMILYDGIVKNNFSRIDAIIETFTADLDEIVSEIKALNPDVVILLQTLYNPQKGYSEEVYGQGAAMLNQAIKDYVRKYDDSVLLVDVGAALTDKETDFARDGVHPSAVGNEKIAQAVLDTLYKNGLGDKTEPVIAVKGRNLVGTDFIAGSVQIYCWILRLFAPVLKTLPI